MDRKTFIKTTVLGASAILGTSGLAMPLPKDSQKISKRDRMLQWLEGNAPAGYTPAAFFLHFDEQHKLGAAAAEKHLEYFRYTDMDFVKIQYEQEYTPVDFLKKPEDWAKLTPKSLAFYEPQLDVVRRLVTAIQKDALIIMTLYSPFMWAGHSATLPVLRRHLEADPEAVKRGLVNLVESQMLFVNACIKIGVDGFYMSTQGSETGQLNDPSIFTNYIKPTDLVAMNRVTSACPFNILHVCDYNAPYTNYNAVLDYPGQVVNCNPRLKDKVLSWQEIFGLFKRPNMGGMDRHGILTHGTDEEIKREVTRVIRQAPDRFILGADCTVPGDMDWQRLKQAISVAHEYTG